jgi:hypothetical protein
LGDQLNDQLLPVSKPKSVPNQLKSDTNPEVTGSDVEEVQFAGASAVSRTKHGKAPVPPVASSPGELIKRIDTFFRFTPSYSF